MKRELYQDKNVPEYWIVDVDHRCVDRWRSSDVAPETLTSNLEWRPDRFVEALIVDLPSYFSRVIGTAAP